MTIRRFPTPAAAARALASHVAGCLNANPNLVLGLPTGRTPVRFYAELVAQFRAGHVDFSRATTFNLDEFVGLTPDDPRSYRAFMQRHFFCHVNLDRRRIHFLNGANPDAAGESRRYEQRIARAGGIDLLLLGLGANGHIGFNEPGASLVSSTHKTRLTRSTRRANAALFGHKVADVPGEALSMGMATILHARRIILLATGASKASAVRRLVMGPITPHVPASFLQLHRSVEVWIDGAAGGRLTARGE